MRDYCGEGGAELLKAEVSKALEHAVERLAADLGFQQPVAEDAFSPG